VGEETDVGHYSISISAQYVTPDSKIYLRKSENVPVLSSGNWFLRTKFVQLPWLVNGTTQLYNSQKECNKLDLTAVIILIGPGGLLLVVPHIYAHAVPVVLVELPEKES
jgi:hypothetical protein